jgi:dTDP-glucose 4,6-dehydratase
MRMLVTGGAGFIGANFVRAVLADSRHTVLVLDRLTYAGHLESLEGLESDGRFRFVRGDVAEPGDVESAYRAARPDTVVHFAAETHVDRSIDGPREFVRTNVVGTQEMLEGARDHIAGLDASARAAFRFVQVSTDEVYGSLGPAGRFTEESPYLPRSPYAASKAGADHLARAYFETFGLPVIVTNTSNNYGPYQFPEKLIPLMTLAALEGKPLPIYGDGRQVRDWIHVDDHVAGIRAAVERGRVGEKYNLGAGEERTNLEIAHALCDALERHAPASGNAALADRGIRRYRDLLTFVEDRPGHDRRYAIDASKAARELHWSAATRLAEGLDRTVAWILAHRGWCEVVAPRGAGRERRGLATAPRTSPLRTSTEEPRR